MSSRVGSFRFESTFFDLPIKNILDLSKRIEKHSLTDFFSKQLNMESQTSSCLKLFQKTYERTPDLGNTEVKSIIHSLSNEPLQTELLEALTLSTVQTEAPSNLLNQSTDSLDKSPDLKFTANYPLKELENHKAISLIFIQILAHNDRWIGFASELNFSAQEVFEISSHENPAESFYNRWINNPFRSPNLVTLETILKKLNLMTELELLKNCGWDSTNAKIKTIAASVTPPQQPEGSSSVDFRPGRPCQKAISFI